MAQLDNPGLSTNSGGAADHDLLGGFGQSMLIRLLTGARQLSLRKSEALFRRGDPGDCTYMIRKGIIKLLVSSPMGEHRIYALRGPRSLVGELSLIDGLPRNTTAEAMTDAELLVISRTAFLAAVKVDPEINAHIVAMLARRLRTLGDEMTLAAFLPMKSRVAGALLRIGEMLGRPAGIGLVGLEDNIAQADIAMMAGASRESVSRALAEWKAERLVTTSTRFRMVLDVGKLTDVASRHE